jgi:hypothetical protein
MPGIVPSAARPWPSAGLTFLPSTLAEPIDASSSAATDWVSRGPPSSPEVLGDARPRESRSGLDRGGAFRSVLGDTPIRTGIRRSAAPSATGHRTANLWPTSSRRRGCGEDVSRYRTRSVRSWGTKPLWHSPSPAGPEHSERSSGHQTLAPPVVVDRDRTDLARSTAGRPSWWRPRTLHGSRDVARAQASVDPRGPAPRRVRRAIDRGGAACRPGRAPDGRGSGPDGGPVWPRSRRQHRWGHRQWVDRRSVG